MTKKLYSTAEIEVSWEPDLCIHSGKCVMGSARVFNPRRRPWVELQHESADRVLEIVSHCPSGALKARRLSPGEQGRNEEGNDPRVGGAVDTQGRPVLSASEGRGAEAQAEVHPKPSITASRNGPLLIEFECVVKDADGNVIREIHKGAFCRCGQSSTKPFCDGTHKKVNFQG